MGPQEVEIVSMVTPITKYAVTVLEPNDIRYHLEKAVHLATTAVAARSGSTFRSMCRTRPWMPARFAVSRLSRRDAENLDRR